MRATLFFLLAILVTSCGMIKNVTRHKDKTKTETDSVATSRINTISTEKEERTIVTTLESDTSITTKGSTVTGSVPARDLKRRPLVLEDDTKKVTVSEDSAGNVQVVATDKDKTVVFKFHKRTEEKILADRKTTTKADTKVAEKKSTSSKSTGTDKDVKRYGVPWYLGLLIILALLVAVYLTLRKRLRFLP